MKKLSDYTSRQLEIELLKRKIKQADAEERRLRECVKAMAMKQVRRIGELRELECK